MAVALAAILVAFALSYWRPLRRVRFAMGYDHLVASGHVFLGVGYVMGHALEARPAVIVNDLTPVVAFVAGWVGFASGMRFDLRMMRLIPARAQVIGLAPAFSAALIVGGVSALILSYAGFSWSQSMPALLIIAAAAAGSGPTLAAIVRARRPGRSSSTGPVLRMVELAAGLDDLPVIVLALAAFAMFDPDPAGMSGLWLAGLGVGGGALLGVATWLFLGGHSTAGERLLLGLAMLAFTAGFAGWLNLSPAAVSAVAAMVLVNLPGQRMDLLVRAVRRVERTAVVVLMIVIGYHVSGYLEWYGLPLLVAMTVLRLWANRWGGDLIPWNGDDNRGLRTMPHWGDGLTPQGILPLMVALSFFHVWRDDLSRTVLGVIAAASLINEIIAPWLMLRLVRRASLEASDTRVTAEVHP